MSNLHTGVHRYEDEYVDEVKDTQTYLPEDIDNIGCVGGTPLPHPFQRQFLRLLVLCLNWIPDSQEAHTMYFTICRMKRFNVGKIKK